MAAASRAPLRVLHLGKFESVGGIERHVRALATGLAASGECSVVNLVSSHARHTDRHTDHGYLTVRAACHGQVASVALSPSLPLLARALEREHRFDLVHLHFPDPLGLLTASLLPRHVRRVISWHSDIVRQQLALRLYGPLQARFVARAAALIAATPQHFSTSTQIPPVAGQLRAVIPYGFDPAPMAWNAAAQTRHDALKQQARGRPIVFTVGRHVYYKGFDVLIDAMRSVDAVAWIGGTGPLSAELRARAQAAGVADRVHFPGRIADDELPGYYQACDVFTMPSTDRSEAFGLVQLEAMHCARPVVATRLGNGVEFVTLDDVSGLLVPPRDAAALATALNRLLADPPLRARLGAAGQQRLVAEFGLQQMVDRTLGVYRAALE